MDPSCTPGSGQPFGVPEDKSPENSPPSLSATLGAPQASSNHSVANEPLSFDRGIIAGERGADLLQTPVTGVSHSGVPRWMARVFLLIEVIIWVELGLILAIVPWTRAWSDNGLVLNYPRIRELLSINFIRGVVTGIGLLDIWVGVWQAIHYKDPVRTK